MDNWDRDRQDKKYKQKLKNVKSTLPKIIYSNNTTTKKKDHQIYLTILIYVKMEFINFHQLIFNQQMIKKILKNKVI